MYFCCGERQQSRCSEILIQHILWHFVTFFHSIWPSHSLPPDYITPVKQAAFSGPVTFILTKAHFWYNSTTPLPLRNLQTAGEPSGVNCEIQANDEMIFMILIAHALKCQQVWHCPTESRSISALCLSMPHSSNAMTARLDVFEPSGFGSGQAEAAERICRIARTI